jgi:hypothetical protein
MRSAKDILSDYRYTKDRLRSKQNAIERLISDLTKITASLDEVGIHQTGLLRNKLAEVIANMEDAYVEVVNAGVDAAESLETCTRLIESASQERWKLLLTLRYLEGCTWSDVAWRMNLTERHVKRMSVDALGCLDAYFIRLDGQYSAEI